MSKKGPTKEWWGRGSLEKLRGVQGKEGGVTPLVSFWLARSLSMRREMAWQA